MGYVGWPHKLVRVVVQVHPERQENKTEGYECGRREKQKKD